MLKIWLIQQANSFGRGWSEKFQKLMKIVLSDIVWELIGSASVALFKALPLMYGLIALDTVEKIHAPQPRKVQVVIRSNV